MAEPKTQYGGYNQRGREGVGWQEREQKKASDAYAKTTEGREMTALREEIKTLKATVARLERGDQLQEGNGISVNGNVIALSASTGQQGAGGGNDVAETFEAIVVVDGVGYNATIDGVIGAAV